MNFFPFQLKFVNLPNMTRELHKTERKECKWTYSCGKWRSRVPRVRREPSGWSWITIEISGNWIAQGEQSRKLWRRFRLGWVCLCGHITTADVESSNNHPKYTVTQTNRVAGGTQSRGLLSIASHHHRKSTRKIISCSSYTNTTCLWHEEINKKFTYYCIKSYLRPLQNSLERRCRINAVTWNHFLKYF